MIVQNKPKQRLKLLLVIIFVASFIAAMISSNAGKIKIESVQIDVRGAELSADLYYPAETSDVDKYPAVIVVPGAGVVKENMRSFAEELAKRDYVVLNLNAYGSGLSETPVYNENDQGIDEYNIFGTPMGALDAINYLKSVEFVDSTRIGICGHSQGSRRAGYAALMDAGYYSYNDVLFNLLNSKFGIAIDKKDLSKDAFGVAKEKLDADLYEQFKLDAESCKATYDTMVKSVCLVGSTAEYCNPTVEVDVAGNTVTRTMKTNVCIINGDYDYGYKSFNNSPTTKKAWYINEAEDIADAGYYSLDDNNSSSKLVGTFRQDTIKTDTELKKAIDNRSLRIVMTTGETHSKNFFSAQTTAKLIDYFNQTLDNHADAAVTSKSSITFYYREFFNLIAMIAMILMLVPILQLFFANEKYTVCCLKENETGEKELPKTIKVLIPVLTVIVGIFSIWQTNKNKCFINFTANKQFPLMITCWAPIRLLVWLSAGTIIIIFVLVIAGKCKDSFVDFIKKNLSVGVKGVSRSLLISIGFISVAFIILAIIQYFFQQDFRFWMTSFGMLKANHWIYVLSYSLLMLPFFLILSIGINYTSDVCLGKSRTNKGLIIVILINCIGIWGLCALNFILAYGGIKTNDLFSTFILTYSTLLSMPINVFVLRKTYNMTRNIWIGVFTCCLLNAWSLVSISGMNAMYVPQTWFSIFLGM